MIIYLCDKGVIYLYLFTSLFCNATSFNIVLIYLCIIYFKIYLYYNCIKLSFLCILSHANCDTLGAILDVALYELQFIIIIILYYIILYYIILYYIILYYIILYYIILYYIIL